MQINWLEDLLALIEADTLSQAAQRRHITQPAFTRRLQQLEKWIGVPLIDRSKRPVEVLPFVAQERLALKELITQTHQFQRRLKQNSTEQAKVYLIQHTLAITHAQTVINRAEGNKIRLITDDNHRLLSRFIEEGEVLLCYQHAQTKHVLGDAVDMEILGQESLLPCCTPFWAKQLDASNTLSVLLYQKPSFFAESMQDIVNEVQKAYPIHVLCESALAAGIKQLVLAGAGIAWLPQSLITKEISSGELVDVSHNLPRVSFDICLYHREH